MFIRGSETYNVEMLSKYGNECFNKFPILKQKENILEEKGLRTFYKDLQKTQQNGIVNIELKKDAFNLKQKKMKILYKERKKKMAKVLTYGNNSSYNPKYNNILKKSTITYNMGLDKTIKSYFVLQEKNILKEIGKYVYSIFKNKSDAEIKNNIQLESILKEAIKLKTSSFQNGNTDTIDSEFKKLLEEFELKLPKGTNLKDLSDSNNIQNPNNDNIDILQDKNDLKLSKTISSKLDDKDRYQSEQDKSLNLIKLLYNHVNKLNSNFNNNVSQDKESKIKNNMGKEKESDIKDKKTKTKMKLTQKDKFISKFKISKIHKYDGNKSTIESKLPINTIHIENEDYNNSKEKIFIDRNNDSNLNSNNTFTKPVIEICRKNQNDEFNTNTHLKSSIFKEKRNINISNISNIDLNEKNRNQKNYFSQNPFETTDSLRKNLVIKNDRKSKLFEVNSFNPRKTIFDVEIEKFNDYYDNSTDYNSKKSENILSKIKSFSLNKIKKEKITLKPLLSEIDVYKFKKYYDKKRIFHSFSKLERKNENDNFNINTANLYYNIDKSLEYLRSDHSNKLIFKKIKMPREDKSFNITSSNSSLINKKNVNNEEILVNDLKIIKENSFKNIRYLYSNRTYSMDKLKDSINNCEILNENNLNGINNSDRKTELLYENDKYYNKESNIDGDVLNKSNLKLKKKNLILSHINKYSKYYKHSLN